MTRYTVVWLRSAQDELADLWTDADDRSAVSSATNAIDVQLSEDAHQKGIELSEGLRAFFVPPLRILFAVREDDYLAEILLVRKL